MDGMIIDRHENSDRNFEKSFRLISLFQIHFHYFKLCFKKSKSRMIILISMIQRIIY